MIELLIVINAILIAICSYFVFNHFRQSKVLKEIINRTLEYQTWAPDGYDAKRLVLERFEEKLKFHLEDKLNEKEREIITREAEQRIQKVADEWCAEFTKENYELLLKEKLKSDVKRRLKDSANETLGCSTYDH